MKGVRCSASHADLARLDAMLHLGQYLWYLCPFLLLLYGPLQRGHSALLAFWFLPCRTLSFMLEARVSYLMLLTTQLSLLPSL